MTVLITRRAALARGVMALAGSHAAHAAGRPVPGVAYRLHATRECSCRACHHHAANKLFVTRTAADRERAHPGCECQVRRTTMSKHEWHELFGPGARPRRESVDRRWEWTRRVLRSGSVSSAGHDHKRLRSAL